MNFSKWTGLGNDFVLLEPGESLDFSSGFEQRIIKLCDRRFGIGADGVVVVTPMDGDGCLVLNGISEGPVSKAVANGVDFEMRIFNADGSEAAMCGNATRCVAKYIQTRGLAKDANTKVFNLHTKSGLVRPALLDDGRVCVDMGLPRTFLGSIKLTADCYDFTAETVSMGNPHAVIFVDDIEKIQLENWGSVLEVDRQFPDRCNIEFAQVVAPGKIRMRVWERGCGVTMACGTGSCATLVAAQRTGRVGVEADVILDGGTLHIKHEEDGPVLMTGPAQEVFKGTI
ncbi:diaminopimelate epimerase [Fibrobacter succinogenes subsp. succinogenes S85]|uniref:Diaminopimelate epimerase n=1 Tax=Fibrobacter succinogenes (strain ATCC 19169 / S85) TaxID=59374 RepID=C9RS69_FIBSS|nr:diaminopimelate epimerase [Fibrobacter succinogenes]ACX75405.1 diaminopimelate epimerase [Fibrobacter succinogenes subsp. succinogenes S85]ADL24864.1 diaminopimelate epimerase [Fibrobacter succinogenes subsp. succinogenes S85]